MMPRWALFWVGLAALWVWMTLHLLAGVGCSGANPNDSLPDDAALNACLAGPGKAVEVVRGSPGYLIQSGLRFVRPKGKLVGIPRGSPPAVFRAMPGLRDYMLVSQVDGARLVNLLFHGAKNQRVGPINCGAGEGRNLSVTGNYWLMDRLVSRDAYCGTNAVVGGYGFVIRNSRFLHGGLREWPQGPWADGLTILWADQALIENNEFEENTDVDLIVGGGQGYVMRNNTITHTRRMGLAGLMVGWFPTNGNGDHTGSLVTSNWISSQPDKLKVGLMVGHHPWQSDIWLADAGTIERNSITGVVTGIWVEGIRGGIVRNNTVLRTQGFPGLFGCQYVAPFAAAHFRGASLQGPFVGLRFDPPPCTAVWAP